MKPIAELRWEQRFAYFVAGAVFASLCLLIQFRWMDIVPYAAFDQQPAWLKGLKQFVAWLPWIAFAVVFIFRLKKGRRVHIGFHFLGTAAPFAVLMGWLFLGPPIAALRHRQSFDAALWSRPDTPARDALWPPRLCMVDDLLKKYQFQGMSRGEVVALLGEPDGTESFRDWDLVYWLGPERGFLRIDSEWLVLRLDDQEKVAEYRITRD